MPKRTLVLGAVLVGAVILIWVALRGGDAPDPDAPDWPDPTVERTAAPASPLTSSDTRPAVARAPPTVDSVVETPGASLFGQVIDAWGEPQSDVNVALVDDFGEVLDEMVSDDFGNFRLIDPRLEARAVVVASERRPLTRLFPREDREMNLLVGATRTVRGFVLDLAGDPVPGIAVRMVPMAFEGTVWSALTDAGGGFVFTGPATAAMIEADGGDLGKDRAWVGASYDERVVDLVLEPIATITVTSSHQPFAGARVLIRCYDSRSFGADQDWAIDAGYIPEPPLTPEQMQELYGEGPYPGSEAYFEPDGENIDDSDNVDESDNIDDSDNVDEMDLAEEGTSDDLSARVMRRMISELMPELAIPDMESMSSQAIAEAIGTQVAALSAEKREALVARIQAPDYMDRITAIATEEAGLAVGDGLQAEPDVNEELVGAEFETAEGDDLEIDEQAMNGEEGYEPTFEPTESDRHAIYVEGVLGEPLSVPANAWYAVSIEPAEGGEIRCAELLVSPGEDYIVPCGGADKTSTITGRFVDREGHPVADVSVALNASEGYLGGRITIAQSQTTTRSDGSFTFELTHHVTAIASVGIGKPTDISEYSLLDFYGRRNVIVTPGEHKELGTMVYLAADERPDSWPDAPYGGIGGLIQLTNDGILVQDMEDDSPLAMAGVEKDDVIVLVDGVPAAELPEDEVFLRLRGEPGTFVDLRFRSAVGELYEVTLERQMMREPSAVWNDVSGAPPDIE